MKFRGWMVCTVAVLTLCMNAPMLTRLARSGFRLATSWRAEYRGTSETVDTARRMASLAKASSKSIAYCRSCDEGLMPIERSRILAMSWESAPCPVRNGLLREIIGVDAIVAAENEPIIDSELKNNGYCIHDTEAGVNLWCRLAGASLEGYLPLAQLRTDQFVAAAYKTLQCMLGSAWQYAFVFPLAAVSMLVWRWRNSNLATVVLGVTFAVVGFSFIFSLSASPDFEWHLDSMERLLWVPSLLVLSECGCFFGRASVVKYS